jgi:hypothetical protein
MLGVQERGTRIAWPPQARAVFKVPRTCQACWHNKACLATAPRVVVARPKSGGNKVERAQMSYSRRRSPERRVARSGQVVVVPSLVPRKENNVWPTRIKWATSWTGITTGGDAKRSSACRGAQLRRGTAQPSSHTRSTFTHTHTRTHARKRRSRP